MKKEFTLYKGQVVVKFNEAQHSYYVNGKRTQSVSSVVSMLDKPQLTLWKLNCTKERLNELVNRNIPITPSYIQEAIEWSNKVADEAKEIGTRVHKYCEEFALACINKTDLPSIPQDIDDKIASGINAFLNWYSNNEIEFLEIEKTVYSRELNYIGTFDALCKINGKLTLVDYKTSKGIWNEQDWQLCGYSIAFKEEFGEQDIDLTLLHFDKETGEFTPHKVDKQDVKELIFKQLVILKNLIKIQ